MEQAESPMVLGVFRERALAKQAIDELRHAGFRDDQIWLPGSGPATGGFLDGIVNRLMGDDDRYSLDALAKEGLSPSELDYYRRELGAGNTVVAVQAYSHKQQARAILNQYGAYDAGTHASLHDVHSIQLREEVLQAQKESVEIGEVIIRKVVVTEEKTITVPIRREEIVIERRSVSSPSPTDQQAQSHMVQEADGRLFELAENESIRIPLYTEQVFIEKRPVVAEELLVSKRAIQEVRRYTDTVRREEPRLEREGNVIIRGDQVEEAASQNDIAETGREDSFIQ